MRKHVFCICENKGAADQHHVSHCKDSTTHLFTNSKIISLKASSHVLSCTAKLVIGLRQVISLCGSYCFVPGYLLM